MKTIRLIPLLVLLAAVRLSAFDINDSNTLVPPDIDINTIDVASVTFNNTLAPPQMGPGYSWLGSTTGAGASLDISFPSKKNLFIVFYASGASQAYTPLIRFNNDAAVRYAMNATSGTTSISSSNAIGIAPFGGEAAAINNAITKAGYFNIYGNDGASFVQGNYQFLVGGSDPFTNLPSYVHGAFVYSPTTKAPVGRVSMSSFIGTGAGGLGGIFKGGSYIEVWGSD